MTSVFFRSHVERLEWLVRTMLTWKRLFVIQEPQALREVLQFKLLPMSNTNQLKNYSRISARSSKPITQSAHNASIATLSAPSSTKAKF